MSRDPRDQVSHGAMGYNEKDRKRWAKFEKAHEPGAFVNDRTKLTGQSQKRNLAIPLDATNRARSVASLLPKATKEVLGDPTYLKPKSTHGAANAICARCGQQDKNVDSLYLECADKRACARRQEEWT